MVHGSTRQPWFLIPRNHGAHSTFREILSGTIVPLFGVEPWNHSSTPKVEPWFMVPLWNHGSSFRGTMVLIPPQPPPPGTNGSRHHSYDI